MSSGMSDFGLQDLLPLIQTSAIVLTLILTFFFSRKQMKNLEWQTQRLVQDLEVRILSDLDAKLYQMGGVLLEHPNLSRVVETKSSQEKTFAMFVLNVCSHAHDMRERGLLIDEEWQGWVEWMKRMFRDGTLKRHWKDPDVKDAFDPVFQRFVEEVILAAGGVR